MHPKSKSEWDKNSNSDDFLRATVEELLNLKRISLNLQAVLETDLSKTVWSPETMKNIQSLDYLSQSLTALSDVWSEISNQDTTDFQIAHPVTLEAVPLRDLKNRLNGLKPDTSTEDSSGRCQLF